MLVRVAEAERKQLPEHDRRDRLSHLRCDQTKSRQRRRREVASAWYVADETPLQDMAAVGGELAEYWGGVYAATDVGDEQAEDLFAVRAGVRRHGVGRAGLRARLGRRYGREVRAKMCSYAFWAGAPDFARSMPDDLAERAQEGGSLLANFNASVTLTIPKGEVLAEEEAVRCVAPAVRPIALMQTGCKLVALMAIRHVPSGAEATAVAPQKGFARGRLIEDCVQGFDGARATAGLRCGRDAVGILFGFAQAFPSLAPVWFVLVLRRMGMARRVINLIEAMYEEIDTTFEVSGCPVATVAVRQGIRQDCPMSGSLFALALDPLIRWMMCQALLRSAPYFAFAADFAAVLGRMREAVPFLLRALDRWKRASGLALKADARRGVDEARFCATR